MGRAPCCSKEGLQRGSWTAIEDTLLIDYIRAHGEGNWRSLPKKAGLLRCGKSCRLRWVNYLRPGIKRGNITPDEDDLIIRLHSLLGNRWSLIAGRLPGRTDNEIKNYWNCRLKKRSVMGETLEKPCTMNKKSCDQIYRPKPFRVTTPWTDNIYNSSPGTDTSNAGEDKGLTAMPWPAADNRGGNGVNAGGGGLVHNQHDDEFEKLYLEYAQLLMADDSVEAVES